jgi:photosystem II stability/assembly factor-like uncharacterized protein
MKRVLNAVSLGFRESFRYRSALRRGDVPMKLSLCFTRKRFRAPIADVISLAGARQVTTPAILSVLAIIAVNPGFAGWTEVNTGLTSTPAGIAEVTIDPSTPSTLYARTFSGTIFKSTDSAASWVPLGGASDVTGVRIDPQDSSIVYAATRRGVLKSADGGASWRGANTGLREASILHLAIDPRTTKTLYAVTARGGISKSDDAGETWNSVSESLTLEFFMSYLVLDPVSPSIVYAVEDHGSIFKSLDGGVNFARIRTGQPATVFTLNALSLAIDPVTPATMYAGTFAIYGSGHGGIAKSTDGGLNWTALNSGVLEGSFVFSLTIDPGSPSTIYARNIDGSIFKSTDGGESWFVTGPPRAANAFGSLVIDPKVPTTLYAGYSDLEGNGTLLKSSDGGVNWVQSSDGLTSLDVRALATSPANPATIYAAVNGNLVKSVDAGASWNQQAGPPMKIQQLVTYPFDGNLLYAEVGRSGCASHEARLFKSNDGGGSWSSISPLQSGCLLGGVNYSGSPPAMAVDSNGDLYIAETDDLDAYYDLLKSSDHGATWGARMWLPAPSGVRTLAVDPTDPSVIFAGLDDLYNWPRGASTLFKTTDGGASWTAIDLGRGSISILAMDPKNSRIVYAGVQGDYSEPKGFQGLFKSYDGGETWLPSNNGLDLLFDLRSRMTAFVIDPSNSNVLYAATSGLGVFQSVDGGSHWVPHNDSLGNLNVFALAVLPGDIGTLSAGPAGGIFNISCCQNSFLSASPDPCVLSEGVCTTYLTWSTTGVSNAQVWVKIDGGPESLYASQLFCSGTECAAPWIQGGGLVYTFTLYDCDSGTCTVNSHEGARAIGSVKVTAIPNSAEITH